MPKAIDEALERVELERERGLSELEEVGTSLDLLQQVYRNPSLPLPVRMRAAGMALQFEHPKLAVMATIDSKDFGERLENAVKRSAKVIEAAPAIEAAATEDKPTTDAKLRPIVPDRRYRSW